MHRVKPKIARFLFLAAAIIVLLSLTPAQDRSGPNQDLKPTVILISIDGFHPAYLEKYPTTTLSLLAKEGVRARWMKPIYPTMTFTNHYSIATGLYADEHGIVNNSIYDPAFKQTFSMRKREELLNGRWWLGEPIWVTAEKQGQRAAAYFFPGSEVEIGGQRPSYWKAYDDHVPNDERVDGVLSWLDLPGAKRPTLILTYFSDVDSAGHDSGPDSEGVRQAVGKVDQALTRLVEGLKRRKIFERVNIIIVSDHGMAQVDSRKIVFLDDYFDTKQAENVVWYAGPINIFARPGMEQELYSTLKTKAPPQIKVYLKKDMPADFHYSKSNRIGDIVVMAEDGWVIQNRATYRPPEAGGGDFRGTHGFDHRLESMRSIFIARGPAFKQSKIVEPFENVDVYQIMTRVLGLKPAKNSGNQATASAVLR
jgi:predicted AlkP superfamily pyrophosphatase or phosphodiesterase